MKWLRTRIHRRKRRHEDGADERADSPRSRLILLVHDASGPASYQLHTFADAPSAEEFVRFWFPTGFEHGILAFWAEHEEPALLRHSDEERGAEVVVLIRDLARREIVYPFSLPDMELARAWITKEAARGLALRQVLLYWAVPARIRRDHWGRVRVTPREPPSSNTLVPPQDGPPHRRFRTEEPLGRAEADHAGTDAEAGEGTKPPAGSSSSEAGTLTVEELLEEINAAELLEEIDRAIRNKRWKQQDGPFRGFDSPRGKF